MDKQKANDEQIINLIPERYHPSEIEPKWEKVWEEKKTFEADIEKAKNPFYNLVMFPYPSAEGLHVGHIIPYSGADTFGRFMRMKGYDVFEPMGFDAFGIHSENFAIKKGIHPAKLTAQTTKYFRDEQMKKLGTLFDWGRMVDTSDPNYYKWTQWLFTEMFKAGLAIRKKALVNWCPSCKTVLSDEQVIDGRCERCKTEVEKKEMEQWFFKISEYAERLLQGTYKIDWSNRTLVAQRNWIGKSEGAVIKFQISSTKSQINSKFQIPKEIEVFTTRPDTLAGATFLVLAPEHEFVSNLVNGLRVALRDVWQAGYGLKEYVEKAKNKPEQERIAEGKEKTGVFTGYYAVNPFTNEEIPIWVADYVLMGYGTGAIMAVPAHDQRDFDFAKKYDLPVKPVIEGWEINEKAYTGVGRIINSGEWDGWKYPEDLNKVIDWLKTHGVGEGKTTYKLRDWCISRQRYWGPPIPMIHCQSCSKNGITYFDYLLNQDKTQNSKLKTQSQNSNFKSSNLRISKSSFELMPGWFPAPVEDLPVLLPDTDDYLPDGSGKSPLAKILSFVKTKCPYCGGEAERETDVSDTFLDSSWYFLRYPSVEAPNPKSQIPHVNSSEFTVQANKLHISNYKQERQLPFDPEITKKWLPVDMYIGGNEHAVLHLMYSRFVTMALHDMGYLTFEEPFTRFFAHGLMIKDGAKMSKSRGNVVNPNTYLEKFGADVLRMYVLFLGPYDAGGDFRDTGIEGMYRFLNRVYRWVINEITNYQFSITNQIPNSNDQNPKPSLRGGNEKTDETISSLERSMHRLIKGVGEDLENLRFNTAIAKMMEFLNEATSVNPKSEIQNPKQNKNTNDQNSKLSLRGGSEATDEAIYLKILLDYILLLAPLAPHLAEELFQEYRKTGDESVFISVHDQKWPIYDESLLHEETVMIVVQVNGKVRGKINAAAGISQAETENLAMKEENVEKHLEGKRVMKKIYIQDKLLNFVV